MMTDRVIFICTIIVAAVYLYATTLIPTLEIGDPLGPKAFPRLIGIAMLFAAGMLGWEMWQARRKNAPPEEAGFDAKVLKVLGAVVVWTGVYYFILEKLGFIIATSIYLLPMMAWFYRGKWVANVLTSIAFSALTYWLFVTLDVRLPRGILPF